MECWERRRWLLTGFKENKAGAGWRSSGSQQLALTLATSKATCPKLRQSSRRTAGSILYPNMTVCSPPDLPAASLLNSPSALGPDVADDSTTKPSDSTTMFSVRPDVCSTPSSQTSSVVTGISGQNVSDKQHL